MMSDWSSIEAIQPQDAGTLRIGTILFEYDGPRAAIFNDESARYVGISSDSDETNGDRWILAPVTRLELKCLLNNMASANDVFQKTEFKVIDVDSSLNIIRVRSAESAQIPIDALPQPGATFPPLADAIRQAEIPDQDALPERCFAFDGPCVHGNAMSFKALADIIETTQRLWNAIAQGLAGTPTRRGTIGNLTSRAELLFARHQPGSFGIAVESSDTDLFDQIAAEYAGLFNGILTREDFSSLVQRLGGNSRVRSALNAYIKALDDSQTNVLCKWSQGQSFAGSGRVRFMRRWSTSSTDRTQDVTVIGRLIALNLKSGTFVFENEEDEEAQEISGDISTDLRAQIDRDRTSYAVGRDARYQVNIKMTERDSLVLDSQHAVLLSIGPVSGQ